MAQFEDHPTVVATRGKAIPERLTVIASAELRRLCIEGLQGGCDVQIKATSRGWLRMLRKEASIGWLLLTLQVRIWGNPK